MCTQVHGEMDLRMVRVPTPTTMETSIQGIGNKTKNKGTVHSKCQQATFTEEGGGWAKSKEKEFIYSPTAMFTKVQCELFRPFQRGIKRRKREV